MQDTNNNSKRINITLPIRTHAIGRRLSRELFGSTNLSGLVAYLINKYDTEMKKQKK